LPHEENSRCRLAPFARPRPGHLARPTQRNNDSGGDELQQKPLHPANGYLLSMLEEQARATVEPIH
jgi:hypothetical protein